MVPLGVVGRDDLRSGVADGVGCAESRFFNAERSGAGGRGW